MSIFRRDEACLGFIRCGGGFRRGMGEEVQAKSGAGAEGDGGGHGDGSWNHLCVLNGADNEAADGADAELEETEGRRRVAGDAGMS